MQNGVSFDLIEGRFTNNTHQKSTIQGKKLTLFKTLLGTNFDDIDTMSFSKNERQEILQLLVHYFELHLDGFKTPKSLAILESKFK